MFGIDDAIMGGLVSGGLKMLGNVFQGQQQADAATQQFQRQQQLTSNAQQFSQQQMQQEQAFNASQADIARGFSAQQQSNAQDFSANQAELNRTFQERMSSTAYQRSRADMLAAGLNPILAAGAGGASTPAGSVGVSPGLGGPAASVHAGGASAPMAGRRDVTGLMEGVVTSAGEMARLKPMIDQIRATTAREGSSTELNEKLAEESVARARTEAMREIKTGEEARNAEAERLNIERKGGEIGLPLGIRLNPEYWRDDRDRPGGSTRSVDEIVNSARARGGYFGSEFRSVGEGESRYYIPGR